MIVVAHLSVLRQRNLYALKMMMAFCSALRARVLCMLLLLVLLLVCGQVLLCRCAEGLLAVLVL